MQDAYPATDLSILGHRTNMDSLSNQYKLPFVL